MWMGAPWGDLTGARMGSCPVRMLMCPVEGVGGSEGLKEGPGGRAGPSPAWVLGRSPTAGSQALCLLPQSSTLRPELQAALARGPESPRNRVPQQGGGSPDPTWWSVCLWEPQSVGGQATMWPPAEGLGSCPLKARKEATAIGLSHNQADPEARDRPSPGLLVVHMGFCFGS